MQLAFLKYLQEIGNPILDTLFMLITNLGSETFYILAITYIYWCCNKKLGIKLLFIAMASFYVNNALKEFFHTQRPFHTEGINTVYKIPLESYSFPSGHAQGTATFWIYLMKKIKSNILYIIGWSIILLVAFSRLYLRVHWPVDIVGGFLIAIAIVILLDYMIERVIKYKIGYRTQVGMCTLFSIIFLLLNFEDTSAKIVGLTTAALIGYSAENRYINFNEKASLLHQILKYVLGVFVFLALQIILKKVFPSGVAFNYARYFILGLWVTFIAPALFVKLGLSKHSKVPGSSIV